MSKWQQAVAKLNEASIRRVSADAERDSLRDVLASLIDMVARAQPDTPPEEPPVVVPPVDPSPPLPPPVYLPPLSPTTLLSVHDGKTGMSHESFLHPILKWRKRGGDWTDAKGLAYGIEPYALMTFAARNAVHTVEADVTALVKRPNAGWFLKAADTVRLAGPEHTIEAERPALIVTRASGVETLYATAFQVQTGSASPTINRIYAGMDATRAMVMQFPDAGEFVSAKVRLTALVYGAKVSIFEILQPRVFDVDAYTPALGLAAKYPRDQGIARDPDVYFGPLAIAATPEEVEQHRTFWHPAGRVANIDPTGGPLGGPALLGKIPQGASGSTISRTHELSRQYIRDAGYVQQGTNPTNGLVTTQVVPRGARPNTALFHTEAYLRYYVRFAPNFMDCNNDGNKLPGISGQGGYWNSVGYFGNSDGNGGAPTNGRKDYTGFTSGFSLRNHMQIRQHEAGNPLGARLLRGLGTYAYYPGQPGTWGDLLPWGDEQIGRVMIGPDRWYGIEQHVKLNTLRGLTTAEQAAYITQRTDERLALIARRETELAAAIAAGKVLTTYEAKLALALAVPLPVFDAAGYDQWGNGGSNRDGVLRCWLYGYAADNKPVGRLVYERNDFTMRLNPEINIDALAWMDHLHGGSNNAEHDHEFAEADVVIARKYIGPKV